MDRRRAAAALLALAACFACSTAAPTSDQTALDLYQEPSEGCYYNFQHYGEGDRIMTNEPCLNCTCHNKMLMCYLRVCPFTKAIGQDCTVEKRGDQCCPIVTCPDVPVDLLTSTSTSSPAEYGGTGIGKVDNYGCSINGKYFPEGAKVPPTPNKPCEHCYCIRNMTTCVMQECTLHVDGCTPIYHKDVCCPVRYFCDHPEDEIPLLDDMTTTVRPTPGFLLTTTTEEIPTTETEVKRQCVENDQLHDDGALIKKENPCEHCYCMKGDIVCVVQECGTPMENEGKNCTSVAPREGQCCPDTYICEGDEVPSELVTKSPIENITTLQPPRRVAEEGSGYRKDETPFTEVPTFASESEGSGDDVETDKPTEAFIPESQTTLEYATTDQAIPHIQLTTSSPTLTDEVKVTTEPDRGLNTIEEEVTETPRSQQTTPIAQTEITVPALPHEAVTSEESQEPSLPEKTTVQDIEKPTQQPEAFEKRTTVGDKTDNLSAVDTSASKDELITEPNIIGEQTTESDSSSLETKITTPADIYEEEQTLPPKVPTVHDDIVEEESQKPHIIDETTTVFEATTESAYVDKLSTEGISDSISSDEGEESKTTEKPVDVQGIPSQIGDEKGSTEDEESKATEKPADGQDIPIRTAEEEGSGYEQTTQPEEGSGHNTVPVEEDITQPSIFDQTSNILQDITIKPSKYVPEHETETALPEIGDHERTTGPTYDITVPYIETTTVLFDDSRRKDTEKLDEDKLSTGTPPSVITSLPSDIESTESDVTVTDKTEEDKLSSDTPSATTLAPSDVETTDHGFTETDKRDEDKLSTYTPNVTTPPTSDVESTESEVAVTKEKDEDKLYTEIPIVTTTAPAYVKSTESDIMVTDEKDQDTYIPTVTPSAPSDVESTESDVAVIDEKDKEKVSTDVPSMTTSAPSEVKPTSHDVTVTEQVSVPTSTQEPEIHAEEGTLPETTDRSETPDSEFTKPAEEPVTSISESEVISTTPEGDKQELPDISNPDENEIAPPGRIPGEGDCLLNGITYQNESIVPSTNKCYSDCKCISSIVKCDPIICSPQPEYMENCQPVYDTPESCCPTYVCDHSKETIPPQSHSQMSGTETPLPSPSVECHGDDCLLIEDKKPVPTAPAECSSDSCQTEVQQTPDICGPDGCNEIVQKPVDACPNGICQLPPRDDQIPISPSVDETQSCKNPEDCKGVKTPEQEIVSPSKPEDCKEGDCNVSQGEPCQGEHCKVLPESGTSSPQDCNDEQGCKPMAIPETNIQTCEGASCDEVKHQICDDENGCKTVESAPCEGENCKTKPVIPQCSGPDCKETDIDVPVTTVTPACEGDLCTGINVPVQPIDTSCDSGNCKADTEKPVAECAGPECIQKPSEPSDETTETVQIFTEPSLGPIKDQETETEPSILSATESSEPLYTISDEIFTEKEKPIEPSETTERIDKITRTPEDITTESSEVSEEKVPEVTLVTELPEMQVTDFRRKDGEPSSTEIEEKLTEKPVVETSEKMETVTPQGTVEQESSTQPALLTESQENEDKDSSATTTSLKQDEPFTTSPISDISEEQTEKSTDISQLSDKITPIVSTTLKQDEPHTESPASEVSEGQAEKSTEISHLPGEETTPESSIKETPESTTLGLELNTIETEHATEPSTDVELKTTEMPVIESHEEGVTKPDSDNEFKTTIHLVTSEPEIEVTTEKPVDMGDKQEQTTTIYQDKFQTQPDVTEGSLITEMPSKDTEPQIATKVPEVPQDQETGSSPSSDEEAITTTKSPEPLEPEFSTITPIVEEEHVTLSQEVPKLPEIVTEQQTKSPLSPETEQTGFDSIPTSPEPHDIPTDFSQSVTTEPAPTIIDQADIKTEKPENYVTEPQPQDNRAGELSTEIDKDVTEAPMQSHVTESDDESPEKVPVTTLPVSEEEIKTDSPVSLITEVEESNPTAESATERPAPSETEKPSIVSEDEAYTEASSLEEEQGSTQPELPGSLGSTVSPEVSEQDIKSESQTTVTFDEVPKETTEYPGTKSDTEELETKPEEFVTNKSVPMFETTEPSVYKPEKDLTEKPVEDEQKTDKPVISESNEKTDKPDEEKNKTELPEIATEEQIAVTEPSEVPIAEVDVTKKPDSSDEEVASTEVPVTQVPDAIEEGPKQPEVTKPDLTVTEPSISIEEPTESEKAETKEPDLGQNEPEIKTEAPTEESTHVEDTETLIKETTTSAPVEIQPAHPAETPEVHDEQSEQKPTDLPVPTEDISSEQPEINVTDQPEFGMTPEDTRRKEPVPSVTTELPPFVEEEVKITQSPEEEETTSSSLDYSETTPYLVELEEHPHVEDTTAGPSEDTPASPSYEDKEQTSTTYPEHIPIETTPEPYSQTERDSVQTTVAVDAQHSESPTELPVSVPVTEATTEPVQEEQEKITEFPVQIPVEDKHTTLIPVIETEKPFSQETEPEKDSEPITSKPTIPALQTTIPEEFIPSKITTAKEDEEVTTQSASLDKFTKPEEKPIEPDTQKPGLNDIQPTDEVPAPEDDGQFPPSGGYGQEPDYGDEDQAFGPGTCRYGGKVYVSAQQIPRDDPCDFCFCFRSDIICLQQSCPPPIHGCHEEPIQGFCCPRYECPVSMATAVNVTTTSTTTTTTLPPHFLPHAYKGAAQRRGCLIKGHTYKVGELVRASSGPCLHCTCGGDGQMKCDPKVCTPEPMLRQMIAAAVSAKRRR